MKKIDTSKMKNFREMLEKALKNPEFKKAYDDLDVEFKILDALMLARTERGLTQKQIAEKIGTKQSAIARFESGMHSPTIPFLKKLAEGLGLKLVIEIEN